MAEFKYWLKNVAKLFCFFSVQTYIYMVSPLSELYQLRPSGHLVPKWWHINVDATSWSHIDVNTKSFLKHVPAGVVLRGVIKYVYVVEKKKKFKTMSCNIYSLYEVLLFLSNFYLWLCLTAFTTLQEQKSGTCVFL